MNKTWLTLFAALLVPGLGIGLSGVGSGMDAEDYWAIYESVFIDWDDSFLPLAAAETVEIKLPGVDLKNCGYDWRAVQEMESFQVKVEAEKAFLKEAGLGPFQEREDGGHEQE